jgi:hypothetical protein
MIYNYFKGSFTGISSTKDLILTVGKNNFYNFNWTYIHIKDIVPIAVYDVESEKVGDYYFTKKIKPSNFWRRTPELFIPVSEEHYYNGELHDVIMKNFTLDSGNHGYIKKDFIELKGTIYFKVEVPPVKPVVKPTIASTAGTNISEKIEDSSITGSSTVYNIGNDNASTSISSSVSNTLPKMSMKLFSILLGVFFWLMLLSFFWVFFHNFFTLALIGFIGWLVSRFLNFSLLKTLFNIAFAAGLLFFLASLFSDKGSLIDPTVPKKDGNVKVGPPIPIKKDGAAEDDIDYKVDKNINWFDFISNKYQLNYSTSVQSYFETQREHTTAEANFRTTTRNPLAYFNKLYTKLDEFDEQKIDSIVRVLGAKAAAKKLNQIQTAEMVTTFIQEIPYVLVHQNTCQQIIQSESGNSFVAQYHADRKPCLANIPGGVQSPYEFLHNLKGDCDTRSLLGYAILKKMKISSSVWVSQAYGHSILGVGLPVGNGVYKTVNGLKHYGVELTNKGFRLGMISPQQRDMSNWDVALYSNNY